MAVDGCHVGGSKLPTGGLLRISSAYLSDPTLLGTAEQEEAS